MFAEKFGFIPKKNVTFDGTTITIGKFKINKKEISCIYFRPFNLMKNEWGTVYFSYDGEDYNPNDFLAKNVIKFTKKQTKDIWSLLDLIGIPIIEKNNDLNTLSSELSSNNKNIVLCPNCQSTDVNFVQNNKKNFSVGKAVAGAALTGGVGTLAGFAGKKGKNQWHCKNCGNLFETK